MSTMSRFARRLLIAAACVSVAAPVSVAAAAPSDAQHATAPASVQANDPFLRNGHSMVNGQYRTSRNGLFRLTIQRDGNVILFRKLGSRWAAIWATDTGGFGAVRLSMQKDGNLVLRKGSKPIWASNTAGSGHGWLAVQDDSNLVVYSGAKKWVWGRRIERVFVWPGHIIRPGVLVLSRSRTHAAGMQADGNFVFYRTRDKKVLWTTRTAGRAGTYARQLRDGNFALFARNGVAIWSTRTNRYPGAFLAVGDNGTLTIWRPNVGPVWKAPTSG